MGSFHRWSAYGTFGRSIRFLFLSTNLISMLLSVVTLSYGAWLCHNRSQYAELLAPSLYVDVSRIMVVISILALVNNFIAFYAVLKELRCMVYSFTTASAIIFFMLFIGGIMGFVFRAKLLLMPLHLKMLTSLKELYGTAEMDEITYAWDSLQTNFQCCGVNGTDNYHVWRTSKWHMHLKEEPKPLFPKSCCLEGRVAECQRLQLPDMASAILLDIPSNSHSNSSIATSSEQLQQLLPIHMNTCYMPLRTDLLYVMHVAAWICVASSLTMLLPAIFSTCYAKLIKK